MSMWLVTTRGFYSVVDDTTDPDGQTLLIRARVRGDLEALGDLLPGIEVRETPDHDYRYRTTATRSAFAEVASKLAAEIDYPNFKNAVASRQGSERAHLYSDVWSTLLRLQRGGLGE